MLDKFSEARTLAFEKQREQNQILKTLSESLTKAIRTAIDNEIKPYVDSIRPKDAVTPVKGVHYFTEAEVEVIKQDILALIPKPQDGKSAEVDYKAIFTYVEDRLKQLPKPKDGKPGESPVIDYAKIIASVLETIPFQVAPIPEKHDLKAVQDYIDKRLKWLANQERRVVGYSSLRQLTDVNLDGVAQDAKGNYLLGISWSQLATTWSTAPTLNTAITGGDVYNYTLNGVTRYRFVPTTYDATQDAFYSEFSNPTLSGLIVTRG